MSSTPHPSPRNPSVSTPSRHPTTPGALKTKIPEVRWEHHPEWTHKIISLCKSHTIIQEGLFHNSRIQKNVTGKPKRYYWEILVEELWGDEIDVKDAEIRRYYANSIGNRLACLKGQYAAMLTRLNTIGDGIGENETDADVFEVKDGMRVPGNAVAKANLLAHYRQQWPWWDDIHSLWGNRPNYNPYCVQSSAPGLDHGADTDAEDALTTTDDRMTSIVTDSNHDADYSDGEEDPTLHHISRDPSSLPEMLPSTPITTTAISTTITDHAAITATPNAALTTVTPTPTITAIPTPTLTPTATERPTPTITASALKRPAPPAEIRNNSRSTKARLTTECIRSEIQGPNGNASNGSNSVNSSTVTAASENIESAAASIRKAELRIEYKKYKLQMKEERKKNRFNAALEVYKILYAQWDSDGRVGPRPTPPLY
ncbi:hypothetical protein BZA77DRAFT_325287, partial [Pyronema omphalodes]